MIQIFIFTIALTASIIFMKRIKKEIPMGQILQDKLTLNEKIVVWILSFLNPLISGAIFYYGWKKVMPIKAKQANNISLFVFLIYLIMVYYSLF